MNLSRLAYVFVCSNSPAKLQRGTTISQAPAVIKLFRHKIATSVEAEQAEMMDSIPPPYGSVPKGKRKYISRQQEELTPEKAATRILGNIPLRSGLLLVTDPCYETMPGERIWCNAVVRIIPHGAYQVRLTTTDSDFMSMSIFHPDYLDAVPNEIAHSHIGVDSTFVSFSDANHKVPLDKMSYEQQRKGLSNWHNSTRVACAGCDDGAYLLLVDRNAQDEIIAAEVLDEYFLEENAPGQE